MSDDNHPVQFESPNYTQTPNALFDNLMSQMGNAELRVVLCAVRKTFGYHKHHDPISITQFIRMTGLSRQGVLDGIDAAINRGVMQQVGIGARNVGIYSLVIDTTSLPTRPVKPVDRSNQQTRTGLPGRPEPVYQVDSQKKIERKEKKDTPASQSDTRKRKSDAPDRITIPAAIMNPLKDEIVKVMGWSWQTMTRTEKGTVQAAAKILAEAGACETDVRRCKDECDTRGWTGYSPMALTKVLSDVRVSTLTPSAKPAPVDLAAHRPTITSGVVKWNNRHE